MHCLCRALHKQLWRGAEWLVRKRALVPKIRAARGVEVAAVVQAVEVAAWAAVELPAARVVAVAADARVVVDKVVVVADVLPVEVVAADKAEAARVVVAADAEVAVVDKVVVAVADVLPVEVEAADKVVAVVAAVV